MAGDEWHRRTTWKARDSAEFQERLRRCRGDGRKAQYLRIQAAVLAGGGEHAGALALLDQQLAEHPSPFETSSSLLQRAQSLDALGLLDEATDAYRASLEAMEAFPNVQPGTELHFAWFLAVRKREPLYDEALQLVERYESRPGGSFFPVERFRVAVVRALIAHDRGRTDDARRFAAIARKEATENHSGLPRHPSLGLVGPLADRLACLNLF